MSRRSVGISLLPYLTVVSYWPGVVAHRQPVRTGVEFRFVMQDADFPMNFIVAALLGAVAVLAIAIWSIKRHKEPRLELDIFPPLEKPGVRIMVPSAEVSDMPLVQHAAHRNFQRLARRLEEIFENDLRHCIELTAAAWKARGLWHRVKDRARYLFNEVL
jgi:hypothetical protein